MHPFLSIPSPTVSYIDLGPVRIHFYALFILLGIALALTSGSIRLKNRGGKGGEIIDVSLWAVPIGLIGARFFHVITHWDDYFAPGKDFLEVFKIWNGGIAIYGGLIFGVAGALLGCRIVGIRFTTYADVIAPGVLLAQGIGRIGNYFNSELFGTPTDLPWGLQIASTNPAYPAGLPAGVTFHPTFAYELIWDVLGFVLLLLVDKQLKLRWGRLFGLYLAYYSVGRFFIEGLRIDPSDVYFGFRTNQWMAIFGIILGMALFIIQDRRHPGDESSIYLPGREPEPETLDELESEQVSANDAG
jgi:prolipoprotein diacylglyceryl transferase